MVGGEVELRDGVEFPVKQKIQAQLYFTVSRRKRHSLLLCSLLPGFLG
jgi:hypothetical protein